MNLSYESLVIGLSQNNWLKFLILSSLIFYLLEMDMGCQVLTGEIQIPFAGLKCGYHFFHI